MPRRLLGGARAILRLVQVLRRPKQVSGTSGSAAFAAGQSSGDIGPHLRLWARLCQFWSCSECRLAHRASTCDGMPCP